MPPDAPATFRPRPVQYLQPPPTVTLPVFLTGDFLDSVVRSAYLRATLALPQGEC